jgi:hypothetical protein
MLPPLPTLLCSFFKSLVHLGQALQNMLDKLGLKSFLRLLRLKILHCIHSSHPQEIPREPCNRFGLPSWRGC